jgi:alpha-1,3-rhamnosyl/mannosyltransferase
LGNDIRLSTALADDPSSGSVDEARLRVAVNAMCLWRPYTGIGQYTLNIARVWARDAHLRPQYFYGNDWSPLAEPRDAPGMGLFKRLVKKVLPRPYEATRALLQMRFDRRLGRSDVYLEPNFLPFRFDGPVVLTVHDLSYVRFARTHPSDRVRIMEKLLPPAVERAAHILTDSNFQKQEIIAHFGLAADRVTACHLGVTEQYRPRSALECAAVLQRHGLAYRKYLLVVGTLEPRKNLLAVLDAYAGLAPALRERYPLVVAGMRGWNTDQFAPRLRSLVQSDAVRRLGFVDETELPAIYSGASAFLYPSLYEGFGLPVVEAMASGVPVIVSDCSSLPEVVGDAGPQLSPDDVHGIGLAMQRMIEDSPWWERCSQAGLQRARRFTWEQCAATTAAVLAQAAGRGAAAIQGHAGAPG